MEYYVLRCDERIQTNFTIMNFMEDYGEFIKPMVKYIRKTAPVPFFTDFLLHKELFDPHYLLSDKLKEVVSFYNNSAIFKAVFLTDEKNSAQKLYWDTQGPCLDCVLTEKIMRVDHISLFAEEIKNATFFFIKYEKQKYIVAREDLLESMLRRFPAGLHFAKVNLIQK